MTKIPTGDIIARSYRFAFGGFFKVLGIVWLPLAIEFAAAFLIFAPVIAALGQLMAHLPNVDANGMPPAFTQTMSGINRYAMLLTVLGFFLRAVMMLGITREALGTRTGLPFVFFAFGKDVWRLFGAYFILYILMMVAVFAVMFVVAIPAVIIGAILASVIDASHLSPLATGVITAIGIVAAVIVLYGAIIYVAIRLGFLLTPVVVVEKTIAIERIWNLSKGNVWRLFLVGLAIILPALIVYLVMLAIIFLHAWPALASMPHGHVPPEVVGAHMSAFFSAMFGQWYLFAPVAAIFAVLVYGMGGSASVFAYQALVPPPKPAEVA